MLSIKNRIEMETTVKLYSLNYSNVKTYLFALLFVAGNITLPQLCQDVYKRQAVGFYHKLGFTDVEKEQLTDGIRYTPMKYIRQK